MAAVSLPGGKRFQHLELGMLETRQREPASRGQLAVAHAA